METINKLESIVIIDDDAATNFIHKRTIKKAGFDCKIEIFTNAFEALEYLGSGEEVEVKNVPPGIIFLDINMPGMSGWDFMEEYQKKNRTDFIVVMLTTSLNPEDEKKVKAYSGIKEFYNKPLTISKLNYLMEKYY